MVQVPSTLCNNRAGPINVCVGWGRLFLSILIKYRIAY